MINLCLFWITITTWLWLKIRNYIYRLFGITVSGEGSSQQMRQKLTDVQSTGTKTSRQTNVAHPLSIHSLESPPSHYSHWLSRLCVWLPPLAERGTSVWSLPVFLSGKIQQCFCSMPGSTFQETTKRQGERGSGRGKDVNISCSSKPQSR